MANSTPTAGARQSVPSQQRARSQSRAPPTSTALVSQDVPSQADNRPLSSQAAPGRLRRQAAKDADEQIHNTVTVDAEYTKAKKSGRGDRFLAKMDSVEEEPKKRRSSAGSSETGGKDGEQQEKRDEVVTMPGRLATEEEIRVTREAIGDDGHTKKKVNNLFSSGSRDRSSPTYAWRLAIELVILQQSHKILSSNPRVLECEHRCDRCYNGYNSPSYGTLPCMIIISAKTPKCLPCVLAGSACSFPELEHSEDAASGSEGHADRNGNSRSNASAAGEGGGDGMEMDCGEELFCAASEERGNLKRGGGGGSDLNVEMEMNMDLDNYDNDVAMVSDIS